MSVLAIARASMLRLLRDRTALFFLIVLPIFVILIIGATVRGFSTFKIGIVNEGGGSAGHELSLALTRASDLNVRTYPSLAAATKGVARGEVLTVVVIPSGMDQRLRAGKTVSVGLMTEQSNSNQQAAATAVASVIASVGTKVEAAEFATTTAGGGYAANLSRATRLQSGVASVPVVSTQVDRTQTILPEGYSYSAPTMLVLFVFLFALSSGANIIETRRLGMYERMAAAPVRARSIVAGELVTFLAVALAQSLLIIAVGAGIFGVSWGNPLGAGALIIVWAFVGAGAGMLAGTLFRTPEQANAAGTTLGIVFGMLGGCMWPLAILSSAFRDFGHVVPQAWAVDAWTDLLSRGGDVVSIAPQLGVLVGFAVLFIALATIRLRHVLS